MRKPPFCICENKEADQLRGNLISAIVFATKLVDFLYFVNPKFQASSHLNLNSLLVKHQIDNPSPGAVSGGN